MDRGARGAPQHRPRAAEARRASRPLARGDPGRDARRLLQLLPAHPPPARGPGPRLGPGGQAHPHAALDLLVAHHHARSRPPTTGRSRRSCCWSNPALRVKNPPALRPKVRPVWSMEEIARTVVKARGLQVHAAGVLAGFSASGSARSAACSGATSTSRAASSTCSAPSRRTRTARSSSTRRRTARRGWCRCPPPPATSSVSCSRRRRSIAWPRARPRNEAGRVVRKKDGTQMAPSTLKSQRWNWVARQRIDPHLPIHGLRDSFGTWVYETYGVKQAQEWLGHSEPATTAALRAPHHGLAGESRGRARRGDAGRAGAARGEGPPGRPRRSSTTSSRSPAGAADPLVGDGSRVRPLRPRTGPGAHLMHRSATPE